MAAAPATRPKLVVGIVVDQLRYDYLTRFRPLFDGGFARLLAHGAVFTNARYEHHPTVTAAGHAAFLTGAPPALSGIIANEWYDRASRSIVEGVSDDAVRLVGGASRAGASPHRLMVSTLGDEMKMAWRGKPRVVGISMKDRGAVLPAGHMADAAYWFDFDSGNMVSSSYFLSELPAWVRDFNTRRVSDRFLGATWNSLRPSPDYSPIQQTMPTASGRPYYEAFWASPFGNDLLEQFTELAIEGEELGLHDVPDLLTVSFSSNDLVGHRTGPDSAESRDLALRTDAAVGRLLSFLDRHVGLEHVLVVLTADHGVAQSRGVLQNDRLPGRATALGAASLAIEHALEARYGHSGWLLNPGKSALYLNLELIAELHLDPAEVERTAALAAGRIDHIYRVYTREQILRGGFHDAVGRRVVNGYYPPRGADILLLDDAHSAPNTHGSAYNYDTHVPVIFMGPGIRAGAYDANIAPTDIAPTLATLLGVERPSGADGRVLVEMLGQ